MPPGSSTAWFEGLSPGEVETAARRIRSGSAGSPGPWPELAVEEEVVADEAAYFAFLQQATVRAVEAALEETAAAEDRQVVHAIRALDDLDRVSNELAERATEWASSRGADVDPGATGIEAVTAWDAESELDRRLVGLAAAVDALQDERDALEAAIERAMPTVAPNLSALAGPLLGARLIALAGDLERLAKLPSGTVQVLGAEDALFAHLHGQASSPKHGVIYTHEYVRGTAPEQRGSASRALAGKLSIAARIDHYAGDRRPALQAELDERIARIRGRDG